MTFLLRPISDPTRLSRELATEVFRGKSFIVWERLSQLEVDYSADDLHKEMVDAVKPTTHRRLLKKRPVPNS